MKNVLPVQRKDCAVSVTPVTPAAGASHKTQETSYRVLGAISVSGAPGGDKDDACVDVGLAKLK